jgi:hypothetical protein
MLFVGLSLMDWQDHAFSDKEREGGAVWRALCGHAVPADLVERRDSGIPECDKCTVLWGEMEEAALMRAFGPPPEDAGIMYGAL